MNSDTMQPSIHDPEHASRSPFAADVRIGLNRPQKRLNCKYFYDERGAALFDRICELPEYYLTRTEMQIMSRYREQMAAAIGPRAMLVELGSGSAVKTRLLLESLAAPAAYVPVDIAAEQLEHVARHIAADHPHLDVAPVCADFTRPFRLPQLRYPSARRVLYFPGSTIGNFSPRQAARFLRQLASIAGPGGALLIGVDLDKDPAVLHAAYNDTEGVTAEFNLNILHRINRELGGTFDPNDFRHYAFYNPRHGRVEMHLVSRREQSVQAAGTHFRFRAGESIFTESSYKHDLNAFVSLADAAGFTLTHVWTDPRRWFSVQLYSTASPADPGSVHHAETAER